MWRWRPPKGVQLNKQWYCSLSCFEQGAAELLGKMNLKVNRGRTIRYRLPLGLLLLSKGLISAQHLQDALKAQRESQRGRLGDWLREQGLVNEDQVTGALGVQWGLPVFHLAQSPGFAECAEMAPLSILEAARMVIVHHMPTSRTVYVAFSDGIDFPALRTLEQMLDCSTQPCVIGDSEMREALDAVRQMVRTPETVIECPHAPRELAVTIREWAESNHAIEVRAALAPECLWVRMENDASTGDLLFRLQESPQEAGEPQAIPAV